MFTSHLRHANLRPGANPWRRAAAVTIVAGAVVLLGACSSPKEKALEHLIESQTGENVDVDLGGKTVKLRTPDGEMVVDSSGDKVVIHSDKGSAVLGAGASIPANFPDVPVPVWETTSVFSGDDGNAMITGRAKGMTAAEVADDLRSDLETAGFEIVTSPVTGVDGLYGVEARNSDFAISFSLSAEGGMYSVRPAGS